MAARSNPYPGSGRPTEAGNLRLFQIDTHIFRVRVDRLDSPAEVYRDGNWVPVVLTAEEVMGLMNGRELSPEETEAFVADRSKDEGVG
jgi:hypothetical protein